MSWQRRTQVTVLVAEDDEEDRMRVKEAWTETQLSDDLRFVVGGEELMEYLRGSGRFADPAVAPRPGLILLDLNMPRKDGREALLEIKSDPLLRDIPVVVLTTSAADEDIARSYYSGGSGYIPKPQTFDVLVDVVRRIGGYWIGTVALPSGAALHGAETAYGWPAMPNNNPGLP